MPEPLLNTTGGGPSSTQLEAILAVAQPDRVRCDQPHCGRSVYRRIHVVRESGKLLVLGSDCYALRYGTDAVSISARYCGGEGRALTQQMVNAPMAVPGVQSEVSVRVLSWMVTMFKELDRVEATPRLPEDGAVLSFRLHPKAGSEPWVRPGQAKP